MSGSKRKYWCPVDTMIYSDDSNRRVIRELESHKVLEQGVLLKSV